MSSQISSFKPPNDHHYLHMNIYCQASKKSSYALYFDFPCGVEVFIELKHYDNELLMNIHLIHILTNPQPFVFLFHQEQSSTTYKHQPSTSHTKI